MNQRQAQNILAQARQFESLNLDEFIGRVYPDRKDLENIELSQMNLSEFMYLSKRIFQQFITEFENRETTLVLPFNFTHPQIGTSTVEAQMQNYFNSISGNNPMAAENVLIWLVAYQVEHGFYSRPATITKDTLNLPVLIKLSERLNLIQTSIINKQKDIDTLYSELDNAKKEIQNLIAQKRDELTQITTNLSTSNTQATQISELLTKGTDQGSRLATLLEQQEQNKQLADKKLHELQELYSTTSDKFAEHVKTVISQIDEFKKH